MNRMITESYIEGEGDRVLFRLSVSDIAVLDIFTDEQTLVRAREFLCDPGRHHQGTQEMRLGSFGPFDVTMNCITNDETIAIFVDGPDFGQEFRGNQSAGLYVAREELITALNLKR